MLLKNSKFKDFMIFKNQGKGGLVYLILDLKTGVKVNSNNNNK
jgi:hypothetical protein